MPIVNLLMSMAFSMIWKTSWEHHEELLSLLVPSAVCHVMKKVVTRFLGSVIIRMYVTDSYFAKLLENYLKNDIDNLGDNLGFDIIDWDTGISHYINK